MTSRIPIVQTTRIARLARDRLRVSRSRTIPRTGPTTKTQMMAAGTQGMPC
jgi:hypothetical protein